MRRVAVDACIVTWGNVQGQNGARITRNNFECRIDWLTAKERLRERASEPRAVHITQTLGNMPLVLAWPARQSFGVAEFAETQAHGVLNHPNHLETRSRSLPSSSANLGPRLLSV